MPRRDASADNKAVILRFIDALNKQGKTAEVLERFSNSPALKSKAASYEARYPGFRINPVDLVAERDLVAIRFFTDLETPSMAQRPPGNVEPDAVRPDAVRPEKVEAIAICRLADGRVTEFWLEADVLGQVAAMGAAPHTAVHAPDAGPGADNGAGSHENREANRSLVQRYLAALNSQQKTLELIQRFASDPALPEHIFAFESGFPGYNLVADEIIAEGDKVVVRFHTKQRHAGEFMGIPATGKVSSITGIIIYRIEKGSIAEHWLQADTWALMQELQAPPEATNPGPRGFKGRSFIAER